MAELLHAYKVQHVGQDPREEMHVIYLPGQPQLGDYVVSRSRAGSAFYTVIALEEFVRLEGAKAKSGVCGILTLESYRPARTSSNFMGRQEFGPPPVMPAPKTRSKHSVTAKLQPTIILVDQTNNLQTALHEYQRSGHVTVQVGEVLTLDASGTPRQYTVKSVVWSYTRDSSQQPLVYIGVEAQDRNYVDLFSYSRAESFTSLAISSPASSSAPPSGRSSEASMSPRPPMPLPRTPEPASASANLYDYIHGDEGSVMLSRSSSVDGLSSSSSVAPSRSSISSGVASVSPRRSPPSVNQMIAFLAEAAEVDGRLSTVACQNLANNHFEMLLRIQTVIAQILSGSAASARPPRHQRLATIPSVGDTQDPNLLSRR